ncbi:hypothetical protein DFP72DRAFT_402430 [Ephemerocybe angulata]|uniref:Uncharacterized protein n=1 Tax=Ephemerocybe angulata TaxID=980116 RepID=A0A8H6HWN7_9AGAR|nr:hypothetical protein DFP72DRAFT_402430 [Tulosesus angulatus]
MRLSSILVSIPLAISLTSSALASHETTHFNSARGYDIDDTITLARRDILAELTTRDLINELAGRLELERRYIWRCGKCKRKFDTSNGDPIVRTNFTEMIDSSDR